MFKKILIIMVLVITSFSFQSTVIAQSSLKAAFIRNNDLWTKIGDKEKKITNGELVRHPKWSHNGEWIAYLKGQDSPYSGDLWLYNIKKKKHYRVMSNITSDFQWSPRDNKIGFLKEKVLYMFNAESSLPYTQIAAQIENFSWLPDGKGFITASKESEKLNDDIILSKVLLGRKVLEIKHFYTVPVKEDELFISTSQFKWSHDHKWIAFLMVPTASLSADGNMLCVLQSNGKVFKRVDEMLNYEEWFQWAPTREVLGYISGVGREAMKNKQMKTVRVPAFVVKDYTPRGFADRDFAWKNKGVLYASRSKESELVEISDRPLPSIFEISKRQRQVTFPSKNEGDFAPHYMGNTLYWIRTDRKTANILVSRPNESKEKQWINNITLGTWYYDKWHWDEVFSLYKGQ